ncbi:MAG TPA: [Fe-Fe] hydrogenase large subunit C-terminal domain-containing protein [Feifaniaceae bacterium]|nr:[Fe-Fe] hydrogenase large subunit C-terminal domain-containing protein [Feifaniaceae bacterium]
MDECLKLKKSNCKNCHKCIRQCPVKSIRFSDAQANIVSEECILCGQCFVVCPQNAKEIRNDLPKARALLREGTPVFASMAPSFVANYQNVTIRSMEQALKKLGFAGVEETAAGATLVKNEYERMIAQGTRDVLISSCCPTVNLLIQKHYPKALPFLAGVVSPMQAHCMDIKRRYPGAKTIFIGPCISKKSEAEQYPGPVDCVLTFEELSLWLSEEGIALAYIEDRNEESRARLFPVAGGILRTMACDRPDYTYLSVDGIENCVHAIKDVLSHNIHHCFIEMSACTGSCVGGPAMDKTHRATVLDYMLVTGYAGKKDFAVRAPNKTELQKTLPPLAVRECAFGDAAIEEVLQKMGKTKPEHELNCGSCGYNSCRDKARAVLLGKADLSMCLPYLKEKAESFSDTIIHNSPNAIFVLSEALEVQQINMAACNLMNLQGPKDVLGDHVVRVLDPTPFLDAYLNGKSIRDQRVYLADYQKYVDQTIVYDKSYHILICFMRDVTEEAKQRASKEAMGRKTLETADRVIEKQMRVVQEVASLLGETTAETKIALTKLKESFGNE